MKNYGTYSDCSGQSQPLDEFHLHELLDRVHVARDSFNSYIAEHPAAVLFEEEIAAIERAFSKMYQTTGSVREQQCTK